jgi:hypothetical protein
VLDGESAERTRDGSCAGGGHEERVGAVAGWRVHAMEGMMAREVDLETVDA